MTESFEEIVRKHEDRIYYFIHHLGIKDVSQDFYQEGLIALWKAYNTYDEQRSDFHTYANWKIKNALIDQIRQENRHMEKEAYYRHLYTDEEGSVPPHEMYDEWLWGEIRSRLTSNEWKWVVQYIFQDKAVAQIAAREGVSRDAVKNWGRHAKRKLRTFAPLVGED